MSLYLRHLQIKARYRLRVSGQSKFIARSCKKVIEKLKNQRGRARNPKTTLGQRKTEWADENLLGKPGAGALSTDLNPRWVETSAEQREQHGSRKRLKKQYELQAKNTLWPSGTPCGLSIREAKPRLWHRSASSPAESQKAVDPCVSG